MITLPDFLLARISEDEAAAADWMRMDDVDQYSSLEARVLAECDAKRRIVARHVAEGGAEDWMDADWLSTMSAEEQAGYCGWCTFDSRTVPFPCPDVRDLALPYSGHPGYRPEWRP